MRRPFFIAVAIALLGVACATRQVREPEKLYFAVEVRQAGEVVGKPKLLGETDRVLKAERRAQPEAAPAYSLRLLPRRDGDHYAVELEVALPGGTQGHAELALLHGQQKKVELGLHPGDLQVSLTLMEVDSPEFRTLMDLVGTDEGRTAGNI